jgi:hypothetical protein
MNFSVLCKYTSIFGLPNTGLHSYRIFNLAIVDVVLTIIGAYLISVVIHVNFPITLIICFIIGILAHQLFCVRTTIDKWLFP